MAQDNGTDRLTRIEIDIAELTKDFKILLQAQVLQADMLDSHAAILSKHAKAMEDHDRAMLESRERMDRSKRESEARGKAIDLRIENLVSTIGAVAGKVA